MPHAPGARVHRAGGACYAGGASSCSGGDAASARVSVVGSAAWERRPRAAAQRRRGGDGCAAASPGGDRRRAPRTRARPGPAISSPRDGTRPASVTISPPSGVDVLGLSSPLEVDAERLRHLLEARARIGDEGARPRRRRSCAPSASSCSSSMSPTTISTRSSIETRPSVPPYSSITSAMWVRVACIRTRRSTAGIEGGTKSTGRRILAEARASSTGRPRRGSAASRRVSRADSRRAGVGPRGDEVEEVADMNHALRVVERLAEDRQARVSGGRNRPSRSPSVVSAAPPRYRPAAPSRRRRGCGGSRAHSAASPAPGARSSVLAGRRRARPRGRRGSNRGTSGRPRQEAVVPARPRALAVRRGLQARSLRLRSSFMAVNSDASAFRPPYRDKGRRCQGWRGLHLESFHDLGLGLDLVIVAEQMQDAMDHEMREVVGQGLALVSASRASVSRRARHRPAAGVPAAPGAGAGKDRTFVGLVLAAPGAVELANRRRRRSEAADFDIACRAGLGDRQRGLDGAARQRLRRRRARPSAPSSSDARWSAITARGLGPCARRADGPPRRRVARRRP